MQNVSFGTLSPNVLANSSSNCGTEMPLVVISRYRSNPFRCRLSPRNQPVPSVDSTPHRCVAHKCFSVLILPQWTRGNDRHQFHNVRYFHSVVPPTKITSGWIGSLRTDAGVMPSWTANAFGHGFRILSNFTCHASHSYSVADASPTTSGTTIHSGGCSHCSALEHIDQNAASSHSLPFDHTTNRPLSNAYGKCLGFLQPFGPIRKPNRPGNRLSNFKALELFAGITIGIFIYNASDGHTRTCRGLYWSIMM